MSTWQCLKSKSDKKLLGRILSLSVSPKAQGSIYEKRSFFISFIKHYTDKGVFAHSDFLKVRNIFNTWDKTCDKNVKSFVSLQLETSDIEILLSAWLQYIVWVEQIDSIWNSHHPEVNFSNLEG